MFPTGKMDGHKNGRCRVCGCLVPLAALQLDTPWLSTPAPLVCEQCRSRWWRIVMRTDTRAWLNDKRVTAARMPASTFFSFHPFANIWSAVLKLHPIRFTIHEKAHYVAIDYANVFQI